MDGEPHKSWKFGRNLIQSVFSDAWILDTSYVPHNLIERVTGFVMDADTVTMLLQRRGC